MDVFWKSIVAYFASLGSATYYWTLGLLLLLFVAWGLTRYWARGRHERRIRAAMEKLSKDMLTDVSLPDGEDHFIFYDYILLTPAGIVVVDVKNFSGLLFGGEKIHTWTQVLGRRSYKFDNPLYPIQARVASVKVLVPDVPVLGYVVFTNAGRFPKGKPERVIMVDRVLDELSHLSKDVAVPPAIDSAWRELKQFVRRYA